MERNPRSSFFRLDMTTPFTLYLCIFFHQPSQKTLTHLKTDDKDRETLHPAIVGQTASTQHTLIQVMFYVWHLLKGDLCFHWASKANSIKSNEQNCLKTYRNTTKPV